MTYRPITPNEIPIVADIQARAFRFPAERYLEAYNGSGRVDHTALRLLENEAGQPVATLNIFTRPVSLNGSMLRVVHLPAALAARRYPAHVYAEFVLQIDDPQLPANSQPLHVRIANGAASVQPTTASPQIRCDITAFSQLHAGVMTAEQARTVGALHGDDATCSALTAALAAAPWTMHPGDWF